MALSSNIYANHIFSEHPTAIYSLDDDASYVSLISDEKRLFDSGGWISSADNSATVAFDDSPTIPPVSLDLDSDIYTSFSISNVIVDDTTATLESPNIFSFEDLSQQLKTFSMAMYLYQQSLYVNWYEIGYVFYDQVLSSDREVVSRVDAAEGNFWVNFDFSYLPEYFDSSSMRIIIRVNVDSGGGGNDYQFTVHGITVGQWAETTSSESMGAQLINNAALGYDGVPVLQYGIEETSGYYIFEDNKLLAKNEGIPMIYGSDKVTRLYPSSQGSPSIILPGNNFLFEKSRYENYSVEFWIKINPKSNQTRRIFGPVDGDYGLYVQRGFLSLVIGNQIGSHPVSEWYRPMLIHIIIKEEYAYLFVNGEQVLSLNINRQNLELSSVNDWVGFYSYEDIETFEIDCVSFYSYPVPMNVAKRRFVYGQGTSDVIDIVKPYQGTTAYVNFSNANYTANQVYPDTSNWAAGYRDNLVATKSSISSPDYVLPEISISGRNLYDLYSDNKAVNSLENSQTFFTFRPHQENSEYTSEGDKWTEQSYLFFDSLNFVDDLISFYGVFGIKQLNSYAPLFTIKKSNSESEFAIILEDSAIKYYFNEELIHTEILSEDDFGYDYNFGYFNPYSIEYVNGYYEPPDELSKYATITAGINIKNFIKNKSYNISQFFENLNDLQMYVGGDTVNTFEEKIFSIGFCNNVNNSDISNNFFDNGIIKNDDAEVIFNHTASYTLRPFVRFNRFFLDISVSSTWEEYFPLSSFAGYPLNIVGNRYYDVDMMQLNLGSPVIADPVEEEISDIRWTYSELFLDYNTPVQRSYAILGTPEISGYFTYEDLNFRKVLEFFLNTDKMDVKTYITFQFLSDGANRPLSDFPYTRKLIEDKYIDAEFENSTGNEYKAYLTKFEFTDKTVVFPPKTIDFERIAMVVHFVINKEAILTTPLQIRDFEITSRALNQYDFNPIGTEYGTPIYPFVRAGIYYDNKEKNPLLISKKELPYLNLTEDSGIKLLGKQTLLTEPAMSIPINEKRVQEFDVGAFQLWMKYDLRSFPTFPYPVFEIQYLDKIIEFVIRRDPSELRGEIVARDKITKVLEEGITYYQNGIRVKDPIISFDEWNSIGISFENPLSFANYYGYITLFRGCTFNNISYFKAAGLVESRNVQNRNWLRVYEDESDNILRWTAWYIDTSATLSSRTNIAYNPSIEVDTTGFVATGGGITVTRDTDFYKYGLASLKCVTGGSNNSGVIFASQSGQRIAVTPNTKYTVSAFIKVPPGSPDKNIRMRIRQYTAVSGGGALSILNSESILVTENDNWLRLFYVFTADSNAQAFGIEFSQQLANQVGSIFHIDGILIEQGTRIDPYFDGSTADGAVLTDDLSWSGTPNDSSSTISFYQFSEDLVRQWRDIYLLGEERTFVLSPKDIYKSFVGTNRIVVDDGETLTIDSESLISLSSVNWSRFTRTPA